MQPLLTGMLRNCKFDHGSVSLGAGVPRQARACWFFRPAAKSLQGSALEEQFFKANFNHPLGARSASGQSQIPPRVPAPEIYGWLTARDNVLFLLHDSRIGLLH